MILVHAVSIWISGQYFSISISCSERVSAKRLDLFYWQIFPIFFQFGSQLWPSYVWHTTCTRRSVASDPENDTPSPSHNVSPATVTSEARCAHGEPHYPPLSPPPPPIICLGRAGNWTPALRVQLQRTELQPPVAPSRLLIKAFREGVIWILI